MSDKNNPQTSVHNKNPNGPDRKYSEIEQTTYEANFLACRASPLLQKVTEFSLDNLGQRFICLDAAADGVYDAGVQNRKKEAAKPKTPSK